MKKTNINVRFAAPLAEEIPIRVVEVDVGWQDPAQIIPEIPEAEPQPATQFQIIVGGSSIGL